MRIRIILLCIVFAYGHQPKISEVLQKEMENSPRGGDHPTIVDEETFFLDMKADEWTFWTSYRLEENNSLTSIWRYTSNPTIIITIVLVDSQQVNYAIAIPEDKCQENIHWECLGILFNICHEADNLINTKICVVIFQGLSSLPDWVRNQLDENNQTNILLMTKYEY